MTWDDFYERFYDLSLSTQKSYAYKLADYGDSEEVFEVLSEFAFHDKKFATRFASRAVDGGVHFAPDHVLEMTLLVDKPVLSRMAETAEPAFDREQLEEIYMLIDDATFARMGNALKARTANTTKPLSAAMILLRYNGCWTMPNMGINPFCPNCV